MDTYRNILVAIDLSDEAEQVLSKAVSMASLYQAELSVVHVAQALTIYGGFPYYASPLDKELHKQADVKATLFEAIDQKSEPFGISKGAIDIRFGYRADQILEKAQSNNIDLIVVGSHGRHGIRLLLGSTANAIVHRAKCDVLTVRISSDNT